MTGQNQGVILEASVNTSQTREGFAEIGQQAGAMAASVARNSQQAAAAVNNIGGGASRSAAQVEAAQRTLISSIQRTTTAMEAGGRTSARYYELLASQRGVDPAVLAPYLAQLRAVEAAQTRATTASTAGATGLDHMGMSARATAAALRGVPAQFTDIITSIQGGQAPLTVLLQQGGQLKDMFGGVGAAAKALGGYVLGLVNPYTIAAVAVGALAIAHHAGAAEAEAYKRTLILSGNAAGATSNQLADISRTIGQVSGSQRIAAEAVTALAGTGRVSVDNLQKFGLVAVEVQKVIGRSIADTVTDFENLGKTPLTALDQINQKYHNITSATFAQVKALQDQGRATEAAKVAQDAYADAVSSQKTKILASLTDWERGWIRIKTATNGAIDAAIDAALGRQETGVQKITKALAERELIEKRIAVAVSKGDSGKEAQFRNDLAQNEITINGIRAKEKSTKDAAAAEAAGIKVTEAKNKWLKDGDQYLSRAAQLERDITVARNEGAAAQLSSGEIEKRVGEVRRKYADIFNDGIDSNIEALKRRAAVEDVLNKRALAQVQANRALGSITESEAIKQTSELEISELDKKRILTEKQLSLAKGKQNSLKEQAELSGQIAVIDEQRLSRSIQLTTDLLLLDEKRAQASRDLFSKGISTAESELAGLQDATKAQNEYNEAIGLNKVQVAALQSTRLDALATLKDETAAALEAIEPGNKLVAVYRDQAEELRKRSQGMISGAGKEFQFDEWKKAVDTYSDIFRTGFADMLNNGKDGWKSFTKSLVTTFKTSVADQIYKMFAQPFVVRMVASFLGVTASTASNLAQAAGGGASGSGVGSYVSVAQSAKTAYDAISSGFAGLSTSVADGVQAGLNATGLSSNILTNGPTANFAGQMASTFAAYAAGSALNSAISGKYETGSGVMTAEKVATAVASYINPLLGVAVGAVSGLINRAFGMGPEEIKSRTLVGSFGANGFGGSTDTAVHQDGGWFRSDRDSVRSVAIDDPTAMALSSAYDQIKTASADFATTLGLNADSIKDRAQSLSIALTDDKAANQKAITDFFVGVGDSIAKELLPTIGDFTKAAKDFGGEAESASAALQRIATDYAFIDVALASINSTFGAVGVGSIAAREKLVDLSGGLEAFGKGVAGFAQNYLSDAERLVPVSKTVSAAFESLGIAMPDTRDQFKALVQSLDLTTEQGASTYASLIKVQDGFAQLHAPMADAAQAAKEAADALASVNKGYQDQIDEILKAGMSATELRAVETKGMDASTVALYDRLAGLKAEAAASTLASEAIQKAKDAAIASAKANAEAFQSFGNALADTMKNAVDAAKALRDFNSSLLTGNLSPLDAEGRYQEAKRQFNASSPGDTAAASTYLDAAKARDAGDFSYSRDFAAVQAKIGAAAMAQDSLAARIPAFWKSLQDGASSTANLSQVSANQVSASIVPARVYAPSGGATDTTKLEAEMKLMREQLAAALAVIANATGKTADLLDQVTEGGSGMVNA